MEKGTAAHPSSTRRPASSSTKPTEDPSMPKPSTTSTRPTLIPDMTLTRPTTDTFMEAAKPTMGTSLLQKSEISQTRTEVRMTQEEYRRQEVRQTLDKVNKIEKVSKMEKMEKMERMECNTTGKVGEISTQENTFAERGTCTMTVTDHLLQSSDNKVFLEDGGGKRPSLVHEETYNAGDAEIERNTNEGTESAREKEKGREEEAMSAEEEDLRKEKEEQEMREAKEEETRGAKEEEVRKAKEREMRLKREENMRREEEERMRIKREELTNQTMLQTSTPIQNREEVASISEEERQALLKEREEFLRIPRQEEEEELARTKKYFITQQEIVFYVKVGKIKTVGFNTICVEGFGRSCQDHSPTVTEAGGGGDSHD